MIKQIADIKDYCEYHLSFHEKMLQDAKKKIQDKERQSRRSPTETQELLDIIRDTKYAITAWKVAAIQTKFAKQDICKAKDLEEQSWLT